MQLFLDLTEFEDALPKLLVDLSCKQHDNCLGARFQLREESGAQDNPPSIYGFFLPDRVKGLSGTDPVLSRTISSTGCKEGGSGT